MPIIRVVVAVSKNETAVNEAFHFREHSCYLVPRQNSFCDCHSQQSLNDHAFENSSMVWSEQYIEFQTHYMGLKEMLNFFLATRNTLEGLSLNPSYNAFVSLEVKSVAISSNRGMVVWRVSVLLAFAKTIRASLPVS